MMEARPDWCDETIAHALGVKLKSVKTARWRMNNREHYRATMEAARRRDGMRPKEEMMWPAASVATLKEMWPTNSATVISKRLGFSRSAVIGKANRLGLCKAKLSKGHAEYLDRYRRDIAEINAIGGGGHVVDR